MNTLPVEIYPALATKAALDAYARYLIARATATSGGEDVTRDLVLSQPGEGEEVPESLEAALAPLEVLYGKTALSAIGIALHGAEPVVRYVEEGVDAAETVVVDEATSDDEEGESNPQSAVSPQAIPTAMETKKESATGASHAALPVDAKAQSMTPSQAAHRRARCIYHVGEHTLFSPFYCPCSAYAYQSIQRQEVWCCKHLLALQLALRVEATGLPQDTLRVRVVDAAAFEQLLWKAL